MNLKRIILFNYKKQNLSKNVGSIQEMQTVKKKGVNKDGEHFQR